MPYASGPDFVEPQPLRRTLQSLCMPISGQVSFRNFVDQSYAVKGYVPIITHTDICMYIYIYMHIMQMCICIYIYISIYISYVYIYMHIYTHIYMRMYVYIYIEVCMYTHHIYCNFFDATGSDSQA